MAATPKLVKIKSGTKDNLPSQKESGTIYFAVLDDSGNQKGKIFADIDGNTRVDFGGINDIVPIELGGTGATTAAQARTNLETVGYEVVTGSGSVAPLGVAYGGTGATTAANARTNLGLGSVATESTVPISKGGTGATTIVDTTYTTARYRASSLHSSTTSPTQNGVIAWTYE